jgi:hypothetical protein
MDTPIFERLEPLMIYDYFYNIRFKSRIPGAWGIQVRKLAYRTDGKLPLQRIFPKQK